MVFINRKAACPVCNKFPVYLVIVNKTPVFSNYNIENPNIYRYGSKHYLDGDILLVSPPTKDRLYRRDSYLYNDVITHKSESDTFAIKTLTTHTDVFGEEREYKENPKPIIVRTANGTKVNIYLNLDFSTPILSVSCSSSARFANIYNLVPGQTYLYKVFNQNNNLISSIYKVNNSYGQFTVLGQIRLIYLPSMRNTRDSGGYVTVNGQKRVKYGKIYRGSQLLPGFYNWDTDGAYNVTQHRRWLSTDSSSDTKAIGGADESDIQEMKRLGITLDIDLRDYNATEAYDSNAGVWKIIRYRPFFIPETDGINYYSISLNTNNSTVTCYYSLRNTSGNGPALFKKFVDKVISELDNGGVIYVHCQQGRDRTGSFMAFLFALLDINDDGILKDYELTSYCSYDGERWGFQYSTGSTPNTYPTIPSGTSDFRTYITNWAKTNAGVTDALIALLKQLLLENVPQ